MTTCYRHPDDDALYECNFCSKPICGKCMRFVDDDDQTIICPECTTEALLESSSEDHEEDEIEKVELQEKLRGVGKLNVEDVFNFKLFLLFLLMLGIYAYMNSFLSKSVTPIEMTSEAVQKAGNPILEISLYVAAIFDYAEDHHGVYPEKLEKLYPGYVDKTTPRVLATKDRYMYTTDSKSGFALSCSISDRFGFKKMYVNKEGVIKIE